MPRQPSRKVQIEVKDHKPELLLTATDEHTIYLKGSWRALDPNDKKDPLVKDSLSGQTSGTFVRKKDSNVITFDNANVRLTGVDSMHGLALGGKGVAVLKNGKYPWMAI